MFVVTESAVSAIRSAIAGLETHVRGPRTFLDGVTRDICASAEGFDFTFNKPSATASCSLCKSIG